MRTTEQYLHVMLFRMFSRVILTFEFVAELRKRSHWSLRTARKKQILAGATEIQKENWG